MKTIAHSNNPLLSKEMKEIWEHMNVRVIILLPIILILGAVFGSFSPAFGQEVEPNDTCPTAQEVGAVTPPFTVDGSLDTPPETPDVDFFMFTGTPNDLLIVDLEGQATGAGTLPDPLLGFFDSSCNLIASNDDSATLNSRLVLTIPADGVFILAATSCCDGSFTGEGGSNGSYKLTIASTAAAGSISGRVVDAVTGDPLRGDEFPFASVELRRCVDDECNLIEFVNFQATDSEGRFLFTSDFLANPLIVGTYQVAAFSNNYEPGQTGSFEVGEGEDRDVGDISLTRIRFAGSISGRVMDAVTGAPLRGDEAPFAFVELHRCLDMECLSFELINFQPTDSEGRFLFSSDLGGNPLIIGEYQVVAFADQYQSGRNDPFEVGEGENLNVGDIPLTLNPIVLSDISPCKELPSGGGICEYTLKVTNTAPTRFKGSGWSLIDSFGIGSLLNFTLFQTGKFGPNSPRPKNFGLNAGKSRVLKFQFDVPDAVTDGTLICARALVGQGTTPSFDTVAERFLFCISKGTTGFSVVPEKKAREMRFQRLGGKAPLPK